MARDDDRINVHHVGGRWGTRGFPTVEAFEADLVNVIYEADADSVAQIREKNRHLESELHVLPYCLADRPGEGTLNINYCPFTSSLYPAKDREEEFTTFLANSDFIFSETMRTMEERPVQLHTLDELLASREADVPAPDFLSIDTQGAEPDIIEGAKDTIARHVLALFVEVEFIEIYERQRLFGEVSKQLDELGFVFAGFERMQRTDPYRMPLGMRGGGFETSADALFLRRLSTVAESPLMLGKLAFIALLFKQPAYAFRCLDMRGGAGKGGHGRIYLRLLDQLAQAAERLPKLSPKKFTERLTFEESKARFQEDSTDPAPGQVALAERNRAFGRELIERADDLRVLLSPTFTPVEEVLNAFGLADQAMRLRNTRCAHGLQYVQSLGLEVGGS
ncbi:MAG: FkbM family methyltransferase [Rhodospirillales bacterium]|jgi:FkbM family methyltransferase|nr:FkbM family methyltransferase [Rhodospirillales bacterium]